MTNPPGPSHNPADPPAWGQQPSGGWGRPEEPAPAEDLPQAADPRVWSAEGSPSGQGRPQQVWNNAPPPQYGAQGYAPPPEGPYGGQQNPGAQPYGGQPYPEGQQQPWPPQSDAQQPGFQQPGVQPTQQWGGQQPASGWGPGYPPLPDAPARSGRSKLPFVLGGIGVLVVVVVLVLGFVTPGFFLSRVFDTAAVQAGVQKVLTDSYGVRGVTAVTCERNIAVTEGAAFTCDATINGQPAKIPVRITSSDGNYEVGRPA